MAAEESFDDLINAIQNAFIKVNQMSETQHLDMLKKYFNEDSSPICMNFNYPYTTALGIKETRHISIPKLCLIPISSLKLNEVSVDFKVKISGKVTLKEKEENKPMLLKNSRSVNPENKSFLGYVPTNRKRSEDSYANITLKFTSEDAPEGVMRIQDELIKISI